MSTQIRVMLVDDHHIFRDGVKMVLEDEERFVVCAEAASVNEALQRIPEAQPEIIMTDISMPGESGIELVRQVKQGYPHIKVLVLSMHNEPDIISDIMMLEADGYILKNIGRKGLIESLDKVADDGSCYSPEVLTALMGKLKKTEKPKDDLSSLSEREIEIIKLVVQELSTSEIAEKLFLSKLTVETHRKNINNKLGIKTIVGLIKLAIRNGLTTA
ncbi:MAG: response regulator transcription factor [Bacteroidota bacterium]